MPEIVQSSIWNEPAEIRIVWITLIATKDEHGYVRGDAKTIARVANVSLESATAALNLFQQPDPHSNTPDNEGRRIEKFGGGWLVLNHDIYRAQDHNAFMRDYMRDRRQKRRESAVVNNKFKQVDNTKLPPVSVSVSVSESGSDSGIGKGDTGEGWTLDQCRAAAATVGVTPAMLQEFWDHYAAVGWIDGAGRKIVNLPAALGKWKAKSASHGKGGGSSITAAPIPPTEADLRQERAEAAIEAARIRTLKQNEEDAAYRKAKSESKGKP